MPPITNDWADALKEKYRKEYYKKLFDFVGREYASGTVYPPGDDIFNAFHLTPLKDVKVVIIGQDPYHEPGQAHGLAFSVKARVEIPPSLRNVYKELNDDIGFRIPNHGCLTEWAKRGVLLLNTTLTVRAHMANSHKDCGWRSFTDEIIRLLSLREEPMVFLLWGAYARSKAPLIAPRHLVLQAPHPSPLSANNGFFGCRHFSKTNAFLADRAIDWSLDDI
jgi:uracil-DNA glycosylase